MMNKCNGKVSDSFSAAVIRRIIDGLPLNGARRKLKEEWNEIASAVETCSPDRDEREKAFEAAIHKFQNADQFREAVANASPDFDFESEMGHGNIATENDSISEIESVVPPLPEYARLTEEQEKQAMKAGKWLDEYIRFADEASPMSPLPLHEAIGLFIGSLAIARRLCVSVSVQENTIFPNLFLLFVGQSTRPRKTTAKRVGTGLLKEAGMEFFLLAERQTPEALNSDLSCRVPKDYNDWPDPAKKHFIEERRIAAQRGMMLEEASHLFDSFNRDYSAGLLPMVLDFYDSPERSASRNTISRGREEVNQVYLPIFGVTTYASLAIHTKEHIHWRNGLWARFAFVLSDDSGSWRFWSPRLEYPEILVKKLKFVAFDLFKLPIAEVTESEVGNGKDKHKVFEVKLSEPLQASEAQISKAARDQWEKYSRATGFDMVPDKPTLVEEKFYANYGRLGTMLIKVAMILATFDASSLPVKIDESHIYRAQMIVERWRANLHSLFQRLRHNPNDALRDRILAVLQKADGDWVTRRNLCRALNLKVNEIMLTILDLIELEEIEAERFQNEKGQPSEKYRILH